MRYALPGSALVHAGIFGIALVGFAWPQPEDAPAPGAVTVDIVSLSSVSSNETSVIESSAAEDRVSAGAEAMPPSETIEPVEPDVLPATVPTQQAVVTEVAEPVEAEASRMTASQTVTAEPVRPEAVQPATEAVVEPIAAEPASEVVSETMEVAVLSTPMEAMTPDNVAPVTPASETPQEPEAVVSPVPHMLSFERPSAPTQRPRPQRSQQEPRAQANRAAPPPSQAGNGGRNNADTAAARASAGQQGQEGGGGTADIAPWERQLRRALANALRYPRAANGARGDVVVRFTVSAGGGVSGVSVVRSSGNPILDQAAIDTVARAAPFPPIPAGLGISRKTVDFPLGFVRN